MCTSFLGLMSTCIISAVLVAVAFLSIWFRAFLMYRIDPPPLLAGVGLSENILYPCIETSASMCFSSMSSHVSLRPMISKFSAWVSTMISSILGGSDCTFARSTFNLLLVSASSAAASSAGGGAAAAPPNGGAPPGGAAPGGAAPVAPGDCGGWGGPPCGCSPPCSLVMLLLWLDRCRRFPMLGGSFGCWLPEFI